MTQTLSRSVRRELQIANFEQKLNQELFESVIPFWEKYSLDKEFGGFFNCLDYDGTVYDKRKHIWMQGRQTWLFAKLYRTVKPRDRWLEIAKIGMDFLTNHAEREDGRVYFEMTQNGTPIYLQRKIFSECFFTMALAEYSLATSSDRYREHVQMSFERIWQWSKDLSQLGRPHYDGAPVVHSLAIPMILLNLIEEVAGNNMSPYYSKRVDICIDNILRHVRKKQKVVLENTGPNGEYLSHSYDGRLLNPGHAIEAGWFLQHWALKRGDKELSETAANIIRWSFDKGWDSKYGGIFYFLDSEGYSPVQLEWSQKLWWPHTEALYATLQNLTLFGHEDDKRRFQLVREYTFTHFPDEEHGGWFGYLNRRGEINQYFKGGPYKGCFHVPRSLYLCLKWLGKF